MKQNAEEQVMEAYYRVVGEAHVDNVLRQLDAAEEVIEGQKVPETLHEWFDGFIKGVKKAQGRQERRQLSKQFMARASVILAIFIAIAGILTVSVEAIRIRVFNMLLETQEQFTEIQFENGSEDLGEASDGTFSSWEDIEVVSGNFYPTYVPEGYIIEDYEVHDMFMHIVYTNGKDRSLIFGQSSMSTSIQIDTEDAQVSHPMIDGVQGIMAEEDGGVILVWHNNLFSYTLTGEISTEEALRMAESIEEQ